jgi:multimeric flavodoxin WrbA
MMRALIVCGSPRPGGNTEQLLRVVSDRLTEKNVDTELVLLHDKLIKPCIACEKCKELKDRTCIEKDDDFHPILEKLIVSQAFIVGSPVYFGSATSQTTSFLHRAGYVARANDKFLAGKVGAPVVVARRAGHNFTYAQLLFFYTINDMIVPGSSYWNVALGRKKGEVMNDEEGLNTARHFAENVAGLLQKLNPR